MKKLTILIIALSIILSTTTFARTDEPSSWAAEEVNKAIEAGYVPVELQSDYQASITREEFSTLFVTMIIQQCNNGLALENELRRAAQDFTDMTPDVILSKISSDVTFTDRDSKMVLVANRLGIINGYGNGKFGPDDLITREQACVMFVNYTKNRRLETTEISWYNDFDTASDWAEDYVYQAVATSLMKGTKLPVFSDRGELLSYGELSLKGNITREQAILMVFRADGNVGGTALYVGGLYPALPDALMSGFEIKDGYVYMKRSGYDNRYSRYIANAPASSELTQFINEITSEEAYTYNVYLSSCNETVYDNLEQIQKVINGETLTLDYGIVKVTHNPSQEYLLKIEYNRNEGLYGYAGYHYMKLNILADYAIEPLELQ